ncbi:glycoside hydrolase family 16 protein [Curtobacterium sp. MCBA15_012]|uniref:glycoside hydrolase family 16 protein n=2 Tax=unclassified Curtobacterium TaxID=257496 RepID=UPI0008DE800A|nr:glycoside hydrolase family 16 protein [Curtobacterium sp. MCBA15_012]WIA99287.1 glycoside hydrolase family 16 protein [Curtobacterium sp. MCBA15_012]
MNRRRVTAAAAALSCVLIAVPTAASANSWCGWWREHHRPPAASSTPTPTEQPEDTTPAPDDRSGDEQPTTEPTETPTEQAETAPDTTPVTAAPSDDTRPPALSFVEDFDTQAAVGRVASTYPQAWQPYPDGTSGIYEPSRTVSVHDGVLDVPLGGAGTAGTFGSLAGAWGHVGGTFSVRAKATGGDGNGAAFMLWPSSNVWSDGEIDFPEGNFEERPQAFQHAMTPGREAERTQVDSGVSWRDWHTYTVQWEPGRSVTYSVDGRVLETITHDVPTTAHRFMFQTGNWGASGNLLVDWVATSE